MLVLVSVAIVVTAGVMPARAQTDVLEINDIAVETSRGQRPIVDVEVTVPARLGDDVLSTEAFSIVENDGPPQHPFFGTTDREEEAPPPPRIVLAMDVSGSMQNAIDSAKQAAEAFVRGLPEGSQIAVITFGDDVEVTGYSTDVSAVSAEIDGIEVDPTAETALYAGVERAARMLSAGSGRRQSIVVLSDGEDTVGGVSSGEAQQAVAAIEADLWAVSLVTPSSDSDALQALTGTEGRVVAAQNAAELEGIYTQLASELSRRYVLRYETLASGPTSVQVTVTADGLTSTAIGDVTIDPTQVTAPGSSAPVTADLEPYVVTVPLLATAPALAVGLTAIALSSMLVWLLILLPRHRSPRELLTLESSVPSARSRPELSSLAEWTTDLADRRLQGGRLGAALDRALERAGLDLRPGELAIIAGSLMLVTFALGVIAAGPLLGLLLAAAVPLLTRLFLSIRRDRRQAAFSEQLTDVLQLMSSSLRAGHGLLQGIDAVARDADEPAASEFHRIIIEHRLGRDLNDAMQNCATRMDNDDFAWVVQAIAIHRDVGGDLSQVLDNIVSTVRDRADILREVRSLSAEGRLSAVVLTALPFVVLLGMNFLNPAYVSQLTGRPIGLVMLTVAGLMMLVGTLWIRRLVKVSL